MDCDEPHSPDKTSNLHAHRLDHTPSKLPAFRFADLHRSHTLQASSLAATPDLHNPSVTKTSTQHKTTSQTTSPPEKDRTVAIPTESHTGYQSNSASKLQEARKGRKAPASHSSNGIETRSGPPPALSTQHSLPSEPPVRTPNKSTTQWALAQQRLTLGNLQPDLPSAGLESTEDRKPQRQQTVSLPATRPRIPPIRSFRSSATRASLGMDNRPFYQYDGADDHDDRDRTLRALEGYANEEDNYTKRDTFSREHEYRDHQTRVNGGTEDLFLDLALDDLSQGYLQDKTTTANKRTSRIALPNNRSSLPPLTNSYLTPMPRRGSDLQGVSTSNSRGQERTVQDQRVERQRYNTSVHGRTSSSPAGPLDLNKSRYPPSATRSTPATPRIFNTREPTYEAQSANSGRRPSSPESTAGSQVRGHAYRQSNLSSFSTPRMYNSSPLVGRMAEPENAPEPQLVAESTDDGTTSTTAPSTVWDELDDLKSRIRKLELTGKPPATSGAAVSRATGERPPTATTTATTISTSPKRGRGASTSIVDINSDAVHAGEAHPLLHAALAKSKVALNPDLYRALETTASDALAVASMVGSVGQPMSSAQSMIGSNGGSIADRQLRRKTESMCRSLTELCIALSDATSQLGASALPRPTSRGKELQIQIENSESSPRPLIATNDALNRTKQSPSRALSRLEARRSSLLATSALPSPRFNPAENTTPTQSSLAGRRTSIMLRKQRAGTEERDNEDEVSFRAPSRATTEIGLSRNSPREYTSQQPLPERAPSTLSNLPARRQYFTNLSPSTAIPSLTSQRRYFDRATPERDSNSVMGRLAEERGQRLPVSVPQNRNSLGLDRTRSLAGPNGRSRARSSVIGGAVAQTP